MRSYRRFVVLVAVALGAGALLASTLGASADAAKSSRAAAPQIKIGFLELSGGIPYSTYVLHSFQSAAKKYNVKLVSCDTQLSIEKAITCAQLFKSQHVQGIANFQGNQAASPRICAAGPEVPVVAVDIPQAPCQDVYFGANNYQTGFLGGKTLGTWAKQNWNCQIDTVVNFNTPINKLVLVRENAETAGVKSVCPNATVTQVAPTAYTTDATIAPFTDLLTRLPGLHHILVLGANDDVAIGAIKAAQSAGRLGDLYVVGQGGDPTSWPYLCGKTPFKNWVGEVGYFPQRYGRLCRADPAQLDQRQEGAQDDLPHTTRHHSKEHRDVLSERLQVDHAAMSESSSNRSTSLLTARGVRKSFGGVEVLHGVDLDADPGSILALLGENGAGKSTLVRILAGDYTPDAAEIADRRQTLLAPDAG